MKVILLEDFSIKEVSDGHARNYLLPKKLAVLATPAAIKQMEKKKEKMSAEISGQEAEAKELAQKISSVELKMKAEAGEKDKLFGSIGSKELADALKEQNGIEIDKKKIIVKEPIKSLGEFMITAKLFHGISAEFKVVVEKK